MAAKSKALAQQIQDGALSFTNLEGCDAQLSVNQNPLVIKYNQLFLIRKDKSRNSPYLSFSPFSDFTKLDDVKRKTLANSIASKILGSIPIYKEIENNLAPDPNKKDRVIEKKNILIQKNFIGQRQNINANEIHSEYKKYIAQQIKNDAKPIHQIYSSVLEISSDDLINPKILANKIFIRLLDPFYSHSKFKFAIFSLYKQEWQHVGYTKGDLIKSLSLAPGETVTLEYHYWDKSIIKSEQELSSELELKSSSTLTQRDSKEVLDELTKNNQLKLDASSKISIPIPPIEISGGNEAGISSQIQPHISDSVKSSVENVVNVSNSFKQTRKIRIEETRDSGREEKQTRVIANTNRCHTLEFKYFELLSNYLVTSSCVGFQPCLLIPFNVVCDGKVFSCKKITAKFILCNEHILKSVLIDSKFLAGFEAAKNIESFKRLKKLFAENISTAVSGNIGSSPSPSTGGSQTDIENEYRNLRRAIISAYDDINEAGDKVGEKFDDIELADVGGIIADFMGFVESIITAIRRFPAWVALNLDSDTHNAIEALNSSQENNRPARQAMRDFFTAVSENDFQFLNPVTGDVADGLEDLGVPFSDQIAGAIFDLGIIGLVGNTVKDDAGLHNAVEAAESFFDATDRNAVGQVTTPPSSTTNPSPSAPVQSSTINDFASISEIADAYVELDRLVCHIECNCEYYKQALWLSKGPDYRANFLTKAKVSQFVNNEVVGFFENYVAFPIIDKSFLQKAIDLDILIKALRKNMPDPVSDLITIPTSSTTMSGQLGECDLCEDYIDKSRDADIRQQNAKAVLDEAEENYKAAKTKVTEQEALRIEARINDGDFTDPIDHTNAKLDITVTNQDNNP